MAHKYQDRPSPEDDDYGRDDRSATAPTEPDPLAELARLIGQTDPFDDIKRGAPMAPMDDPVDHFEPLPPIEAPIKDEVPGGPPLWMQRRMVQPNSSSSSPEQVESPPHPVLRRAAVYPDNQHQQPEPQSYHQVDPDRYDDVLYGKRPDQQPAYAYGDHVPRDAYEGQFPRETYEDAPFGYEDGYGGAESTPERRRKMATVVAILVLAVVGTGAAFAYRTFVGTAPSGEPPVIRADTEPTKIVPQQATSDDAVGKLLQDRMSTENGTEQMVSREEQPVDVKDAVNAGPRVVFPPLNQNGNPPSAASVAPNIKPPATVANGTIAGDEPRKVRTMTVRGDQADLAAAGVGRPEFRESHAADTAPAPVSPQAAETRTRMASTNPAAQAPAAASTGGYVVQVSSQRNEADAQASFRVLQGKFPSMLGSRTPLIKRADLGARGVYYRAMVGPFGSSGEASRFCGSLKSAGGQCVVQRN
ncbi:SPOR domain-containing protein [Nitrobacter sp. Nb-311A]|uniref:SPOR domain-containing protein n=1 Tax=Nitrobacter sp. Nb-311A TaxID=314253 RepID=UPI00032318E5|nr:SPOR domain-containing protein [Nitrobacter sp. Nb-311A]